MGLEDQRVRAAVELDLASAREYVGLHEYDGVLQDLSPAAVSTALKSLMTMSCNRSPRA